MMENTEMQCFCLEIKCTWITLAHVADGEAVKLVS